MFATISVSPAEEGIRIVGIEPDRLVVIGDGAIEIVLRPIGLAPAIERRWRLGLPRDRGVIIRDGAVELALCMVDRRAFHERWRRLRIAACRVFALAGDDLSRKFL